MSFIEYLNSIAHPQQVQILQLCHTWLVEDLRLSYNFRYNIPFYDHKKWICYLNPIKNNGIEFAFLHGRLLSDPEGKLNSKGRKMVKGIDLYKPELIPFQDLEFFIMESIEKSLK